MHFNFNMKCTLFVSPCERCSSVCVCVCVCGILVAAVVCPLPPFCACVSGIPFTPESSLLHFRFAISLNSNIRHKSSTLQHGFCALKRYRYVCLFVLVSVTVCVCVCVWVGGSWFGWGHGDPIHTHTSTHSHRERNVAQNGR